MSLIDIIRKLNRKNTPAAKEITPKNASGTSAGIRNTCKACGKPFSVDPSLDYIPNYCMECKKRIMQEKEEKQRAGVPRKIRRKCKACGTYFTFPNTLEHFPSYCPNCRKKHKAEMKAKYSRSGKEKDTQKRDAE